ncbi:hypothetical protein MATL_G00122630 [Megalops atlanticus]|uniref:Uncharacterized protein n=1 Tax=Megalops atlanticus TaxID=7932 RepID=A0A9D3T548_MEGAT|nr:hypothetical protein MATL_G00122630 [Megalops atlanticus]
MHICSGTPYWTAAAGEGGREESPLPKPNPDHLGHLQEAGAGAGACPAPSVRGHWWGRCLCAGSPDRKWTAHKIAFAEESLGASSPNISRECFWGGGTPPVLLLVHAMGRLSISFLPDVPFPSAA